MKFKHTLRRRIIVTFFLLMFALCGAFAIAVFLVIHGLERELFYSQLERNAEWLMQSLKTGSTPALPPGTQVYIVEGNQFSELPDYLRGIKTDRAEIDLGQEAFHVIVQKEGNTRYYLVQDQTQFENLEESIGTTIAIGFIFALAGSVWLGSITANKIIAPVIELSTRVQKANLGETQLENLPEDFSEDEVGMLAAAFGHYAHKIQELLEREKLFTGDVSHELRTPLMVISSSCELLLESSGNDKKRIEVLSRIHRSSQEMRTLVETFLILSRESANSTDHFSHFPADKIIEEEIGEISEAARSNGVETLLQVNSPLQIYGNPYLFRVVIKNLLRNAHHNTRQGAITVTINPGAIHVEDTGRGIPVEFKDSIFDRHYRVPSLVQAEQGEGLGLSIVKRICDYHHWKIQCESVQPHGCRFVLLISPAHQ